MKRGDLLVAAGLALIAALVTQVDFSKLDLPDAKGRERKTQERCEVKGDAFTPAGAEKVAKCIARRKHGYRGTELVALDKLMTWESGWSYTADNPTSHALGIPQCMTNLYPECGTEKFAETPVMQVRWMLRYIDIRYEVPSIAWHKHQARCSSALSCWY